MVEDTVIFDDNERRCDYICYTIQIFIICILVFFILYVYVFLYKMIESMNFNINYGT